jgi:hypothetical protein
MDWDWLTDWLDAAFAWLVELLLWLPNKVYELFLAGLLAVVNAIPVPSWATGIDLDWIPSGMAYWLEPFNVGLGLTCVLGGVLWRFLIRRIPVIG